MTFWKKLNQGHEFLGMPNEDINKYSSAVGMFIKEEFNFALNLMRSIHQCFAALNKICKELATPQEKDMNIAISLMNHEVKYKITYRYSFQFGAFIDSRVLILCFVDSRELAPDMERPKRTKTIFANYYTKYIWFETVEKRRNYTIAQTTIELKHIIPPRGISHEPQTRFFSVYIYIY